MSASSQQVAGVKVRVQLGSGQNKSGFLSDHAAGQESVWG